MASEVVQRGREAWERLKCGSRSWDDWLLVGVALIELAQLRCATGVRPTRQAQDMRTRSTASCSNIDLTCHCRIERSFS